ncbi:MAG: Imidazoleglycerol-phosphate dehydratase, partial [Acidobacteriota bacterium]|nr:Imidazoleglycerol-phosphate dehydratase [Acidobacteriota bacterium]
MSRFVRTEVRALRAYTLDLSPCRFKLDQNEVPWELPRRIKEEIARRLVDREWARYPDFHAARLRERLAAAHGWVPAGVLVGNGSNELLAATMAAVGGPGREILGLAPSFGLYPVFALQSGARYRAVGPRADLALPTDELEREIDRDPRRAVLVASPNNPTGEAIPPATIARWAQKLAAGDAPLLLDNAYGEFCRHDYRPLLARHPNLVIFRTFSKAWSLAGLRLGYLLAAPELVGEILKVKLPYNLGLAGAIAGELALDNAALVERRVRLLVARREQWRALLARSQDEGFDSEANFL